MELCCGCNRSDEYGRKARMVKLTHIKELPKLSDSTRPCLGRNDSASPLEAPRIF
jgi:hypothetical protein